MVSSSSPPSAGELIWVDFTPTSGTEQSGRRPALVVSDRHYNDASGRALVMPITSRVRGWPFEVALPEAGPIQGIVLVDQIRCIDWRARGARSAGPSAPGVLEEARAKLAALVGLE
jgi:mRNA interferase MazF